MKEQLRKEMYKHIAAYNPYATESYLDGLSTQAVINYTHPLDRGNFQFRFDRLED